MRYTNTAALYSVPARSSGLFSPAPLAQPRPTVFVLSISKQLRPVLNSEKASRHPESPLVGLRSHVPVERICVPSPNPVTIQANVIHVLIWREIGGCRSFLSFPSLRVPPVSFPQHCRFNSPRTHRWDEQLSACLRPFSKYSLKSRGLLITDSC